MERFRVGLVMSNKVEISYLIDKDNDNIFFDLLAIAEAGFYRIKEFMDSDAFLDIVIDYKEFTGREFDIRELKII